MPAKVVLTTTPLVSRIMVSSFRTASSLEIFLLSFRPFLTQCSTMGLSAMTQAETRGPKRSPLPLSSSPAWSSNHSGWRTSSYPRSGVLVITDSRTKETNSSVPLPWMTSLPDS